MRFQPYGLSFRGKNAVFRSVGAKARFVTRLLLQAVLFQPGGGLFPGCGRFGDLLQSGYGILHQGGGFSGVVALAVQDERVVDVHGAGQPVAFVQGGNAGLERLPLTGGRRHQQIVGTYTRAAQGLHPAGHEPFVRAVIVPVQFSQHGHADGLGGVAEGKAVLPEARPAGRRAGGPERLAKVDMPAGILEEEIRRQGVVEDIAIRPGGGRAGIIVAFLRQQFTGAHLFGHAAAHFRKPLVVDDGHRAGAAARQQKGAAQQCGETCRHGIPPEKIGRTGRERLLVSSLVPVVK